MASTRLGYMGVKREGVSTPGTAVIPTHFIRYKEGDISYNQEIIANNPIQNNRWNPISAVPGKIDTNGTYTFDLDAREAVHWLSLALGTLVSADVSSATDASVYSHTMTVANSLPTLTVEQGKGNLTDTTNNRQNYSVERSYGVYANKFTISGSDGIIDLSVDVIALGQLQTAFMATDEAAAQTDLSLKSIEGFVATDVVTLYDDTPQSETSTISAVTPASKEITVGAISNSYTVANNAKVELQPLSPSYADDPKEYSFVHATFLSGATLAAATTEKNVENWEFSYENNLEERYGSLRSSPSVIAPKGAMATFKFTRYFENVEDRDNYLLQEKSAGKLTLDLQEIVSSTDTNNQTYQIVIEMNNLRFTTYEMPTGTDELYAVEVEATCFYDSGDGQAVRIVAYNDKIGTTYTA
ncbi:MAG: phage tail tube protein [Calditrichia bacterium]